GAGLGGAGLADARPGGVNPGGAGGAPAAPPAAAGLAALRAAVDGDAYARRGCPEGPGTGRGTGGDAADRSAPVPADGSGARASAWCRGRAGIALAVLDSPAALDDPYLAAWSRGTAEELGRGRPAPDDSLCHGEAGLCELLGHGALEDARPHRIRRAGALLASVEETGAVSGTPEGVPHPGLLTGLAGIGHGLLRAGFPDRVPSALLLRTSRPGPAPEAGLRRTAPGKTAHDGPSPGRAAPDGRRPRPTP
ncbi:lanthionine synthetase LanC family protein, partial [Streptomyces sp. NPDC006460]|uniref:lanthionine synthetase LanC family protein n=1 Tax=Streptomyces sp. NPDC006460 TaxID=3154304 RepID=UPI0033B46287